MDDISGDWRILRIREEDGRAVGRPSTAAQTYPTRTGALSQLEVDLRAAVDVTRILRTTHGFMADDAHGRTHYWAIWVTPTIVQRIERTAAEQYLAERRKDPEYEAAYQAAYQAVRRA